MARTRGLLYADTSALVKLVVREAESDALAAELQRWADVAASALIRVELPLASALSLGDDISVVLSYDRRMQEAAQRLGLQVLAPS